jgi:hypothetical protein
MDPRDKILKMIAEKQNHAQLESDLVVAIEWVNNRAGHAAASCHTGTSGGNVYRSIAVALRHGVQQGIIEIKRKED